MPPLSWSLKVVVGLALIAYAIEGAFHGRLAADIRGGQALVLIGATLSLVHYGLLKLENPRLAEPVVLVTDGGLFRWVRHPMYLGDALVLGGLALLRPTPLALGLLTVGVVALVVTAHREDDALRERFGPAFLDWRARTSALVPFVW